MRFPIGPTIVGAFALIALVGPWLAPYPPHAIDLQRAFELPSAAHLLGTGDNGVDLLSVLLHGARLAALVSIGAVGASVLIGATLGLIAGYRGGVADPLITGLAGENWMRLIGDSFD